MQLAHNNRKLAPQVDTVFFMTSLEHGYVSSSLVKEIATFGGDVSEMVPPAVQQRLLALGSPDAAAASVTRGGVRSRFHTLGRRTE
jgi:pantetheine-phosphate adenylyltransferase